jgi:hypothetical protein
MDLAARFKPQFIASRLLMQNAIRHHITLTLLAASLAVMVAPGTALAQSGSAGGSIGNDEKSLSGSRSADPSDPHGEAGPKRTSREDPAHDEAAVAVAAISTARGSSFQSARPVPAAARRRSS